MQQISAGAGFWDGFCIGVGALGLVSGFLKLTPVGAVALTSAEIGCLVYETYQATK